MNLSFYTPIAYDYKYAIATILSYYKIADEIILGIDEDNISWSHMKYNFDEADFNARIVKIDTEKKIKIVKSNFHDAPLPMTNDTNERNYLTHFCKRGNFIIGIDSDEVLLNPDTFKIWMNTMQPTADIKCKLFTVYKNFGDKLLNVEPDEMTTIGTTKVHCYTMCRNTDTKIKTLTINSPLEILHFSWARNEQEMWQKLKNWGHSADFDINKYFLLWKSATLENYKTMTMLHPLGMKANWTHLSLIDLSKYNLSEELLKEIKAF